MEKRSELFFVTFVSRPIPFTYIPPTGHECGRKPIAMYLISGHSLRRRCANNTALFVGDRGRFRLQIRNLETLLKQQQNIKLSILRSSGDHRCRDVLELICQRQGSWKKKLDPAVLFQFAQTVKEANIDQPAAQGLCPEITQSKSPAHQHTQSVR